MLFNEKDIIFRLCYQIFECNNQQHIPLEMKYVIYESFVIFLAIRYGFKYFNTMHEAQVEIERIKSKLVLETELLKYADKIKCSYESFHVLKKKLKMLKEDAEVKNLDDLKSKINEVNKVIDNFHSKINILYFITHI